MPNSFLILPRTIIHSKKYRSLLDNDADMAYMYMCDRMKVSIKNKWIDHDSGKYFMYYGREELAKVTRVGKTKMSHILKTFNDLGLIIRKKDPVKHCYRIFMPKFRWRTGQCSNSEQRSHNKSNNNKSHEKKHDNRLKGVEHRKQQSTAKNRSEIKISACDPVFDKQNADKAVKFTRIPQPVVNQLRASLGGSKLQNSIHILAVTARYSVLKEHVNKKTGKAPAWVTSALDYDSNEYYQWKHGTSFAEYIDHGLRKAFHNARNMWGYFMAVCKHYYHMAVTWFDQNRPARVSFKSNRNDPDIPIFKI